VYDALVHDMKVSDDLPVSIDTTIYASGRAVSIGLRRGIDSRLSELLRHLDGGCGVRHCPGLYGILHALSDAEERRYGLPNCEMQDDVDAIEGDEQGPLGTSHAAPGEEQRRQSRRPDEVGPVETQYERIRRYRTVRVP